MAIVARVSCVVVAWYTLNIARVAWREQNTLGGVLTALLALVALALSWGVLWWNA